MTETRILSGKVVSDAVYTGLESRIQSLKEAMWAIKSQKYTT